MRRFQNVLSHLELVVVIVLDHLRIGDELGYVYIHFFNREVTCTGLSHRNAIAVLQYRAFLSLLPLSLPLSFLVLLKLIDTPRHHDRVPRALLDSRTLLVHPRHHLKKKEKTKKGFGAPPWVGADMRSSGSLSQIFLKFEVVWSSFSFPLLSSFYTG